MTAPRPAVLPPAWISQGAGGYPRSMACRRVVLAALLWLVPALLLGACRRGDGSASAPDVPRPACDASSVETLMRCVEKERWADDLAFVAQPRSPGSKHWQAVQDLCAARFAEHGYTVERHDYGTGINVLGVRAGESPEQVVVSAHYDHIPGCSGADDNASGVAGVLETARVLAAGRWRRTLVVACWDQEEDGMIGSRAWAARARERGEAIAAAFIYEMIGFRVDAPDSQRLPPGSELVFPAVVAGIAERGNRGDFLAAIGDSGSHEALAAFERRAGAVELPVVTLALSPLLQRAAAAADLDRSDHSAFWRNDYPGIMLTDTADFRNPHYHCEFGEDAAETLDADFAARTVRATVGAAAELLGAGSRG